MKFGSRTSQRDINFAIVDEVDSILIDEARTPLIISGPAEEVDRILLRSRPHRSAPQARRRDAGEPKRKARGARSDGRLSRRREAQDGDADRKRHGESEQMLGNRLQPGGLYDRPTCRFLHHILQSLRAHALYKRDVDYMVKDGEVVIVDEFTGRSCRPPLERRPAPGGSKAKEKVKIERAKPDARNRHLPELLRKYKKLSGMTAPPNTRRGVRQDLQTRRRRHPAKPAAPKIENPDLV